MSTSCNFHMSGNILLLIFFQPLKNVKTIIFFWAIQQQAAGSICPMGYSLLAFAPVYEPQMGMQYSQPPANPKWIKHY